MSVERADRLAKLVSEEGLERLLVTNLVNVRYLTGFTGSNGACICGPGDRAFLTDFRYIERAASEIGGWELVAVSVAWTTGLAERLSGQIGLPLNLAHERVMALAVSARPRPSNSFFGDRGR